MYNVANAILGVIFLAYPFESIKYLQIEIEKTKQGRFLCKLKNYKNKFFSSSLNLFFTTSVYVIRSKNIKYSFLCSLIVIKQRKKKRLQIIVVRE